MKFSVTTEQRASIFECAGIDAALAHPAARSAPSGARLLDESGEVIAVRIIDRTDDGFTLRWFGPFFCDCAGEAGQITPCLAPRPPHEGAQNASAAPTCDVNESATFATAASDDCGENDVAECTTATRRGA